MSFASYTLIGDVAKAYQIKLLEEEFVRPVEMIVSEALRSDLAFARKFVASDRSEYAICESIIYPVLREVWKKYTQDLTLWSHISISYNADLCGTPDYFVAPLSELGPWVQENPYLMIVESKKDDASQGWAQCLAAMIAAQKINGRPEQTIYGITTNGRVWQFGRLKADELIRDTRLFVLDRLEELCASVSYAFEQCRQELHRQPRAA